MNDCIKVVDASVTFHFLEKAGESAFEGKHSVIPILRG